MADEYPAAFRRHLQARPLAQAAGFARFQARLLRSGDRRRDSARLRAAEATGAAVEATGTDLRPPSHHYRGHRGPWIEDHFLRAWLEAAPAEILRYLPIFWTDIYLHVQNHWFTPGQHLRIFREIDAVLERLQEGRNRAFTVVEYDHPIWDWHAFPRNVAVFSAGGWGDIPIPLLKGSPPFACPAKDLTLSFIGRLGGASDANQVRSRMHATLREIAVFYEGPDWHAWMGRSVFSLCPRGLGRTSFRLYEALSVGSIPIYLWDDHPWLPYADELDWSEFSLCLRIDEIERLPSLLAGFSAARIETMQRRIAELYKDYFTLEGASRQILRRARHLADHPAEFASLMERRPYPPGVTPTAEVPAWLRA